MKELSVEEQTKIRNEFEFRSLWDEKLQKETSQWVKNGRMLTSSGIPILNEKYDPRAEKMKEPRKKRNSHKKRGWIDYSRQAS